ARADTSAVSSTSAEARGGPEVSAGSPRGCERVRSTCRSASSLPGAAPGRYAPPPRPRNRGSGLRVHIPIRGRATGRGRRADAAAAGGAGGPDRLRLALRPAPPVGRPLRPPFHGGRGPGRGTDAGHLREALPTCSPLSTDGPLQDLPLQGGGQPLPQRGAEGRVPGGARA